MKYIQVSLINLLDHALLLSRDENNNLVGQKYPRDYGDYFKVYVRTFVIFRLILDWWP